MNTQTLSYVNAENIIPAEWRFWFWEALSESNSVTFGDIDFSLISAETFWEEIQDILDYDLHPVSTDEVEKIKTTLKELDKKDVYINIA